MLPYYALLCTLSFFLFTVIIFATVGFFEFNPSFILVAADDAPTSSDVFCSSPMACFWQVLYGAVKGGDIAGIMEDIDPSMGETYYARILFDIFFFIAVIVLLFDMVAGIIVDTFVSLREETEARNEICSNEVFVSGVTREKCTEVGVSFEEHQSRFQNTWYYVFFIAYLKEKDKDDLDGAEYYVWNCVQEVDFKWFPRLTSSVLDGAGAEKEEEDIGSRLDRIENILNEVIKSNGAVHESNTKK